MGKNKNKHSHFPMHPSTLPQSASGVASLPSTAQAQDAAALRHQAEIDVPEATPAVEQSPATAMDPARVIRDAREAKSRWDQGSQELKKRTADLEGRHRVRGEELERRDRDIRESEGRLRDAQRELETQKNEWRKEKTETEGRFLKREEVLAAREADAVAGFLRRKSEMLESLDAEIARRAKTAAEQDERHQQALAEHEQKLQAANGSRRAEVEEARSKLAQERRELEKALRDAHWMQEDLKEQKAALERRLSDLVRAREIEFNEGLKAAHSRIADLAQQVQAQEAVNRAAGGLSLQQLLSENKTLRQERDRLREDLSTRATDEQTQRLGMLESEGESLRSELTHLRQKLNQSERLLAKQTVSVSELENLKDLKTAWECREAALRAANEQLRAELETLTKRLSDKVPFPELTKLDEDPELQKMPESDDASAYPDLATVVKRVRSAMAQKTAERPSFFYSPTDVRCFLAGLASNRLHLLQGISGTGKSSLPREFARVLGWQTVFVEVQSSWRDKADILGFFNAFEQRFYEHTCLQALYRAQCPRHSGRPFLIVLDEMNLAQTEHYFADFLSALEQPSKDQRVSLMTTSITPHPKRLLGGKSIALPPNVWFIGTANHDESTKDFADKTYDRANVMEFPRHPEQFAPGRPESVPPLGLENLQALFDKAEHDHRDQVREALRFLERDLRPSLEDLSLGWGNRFERQLGRFLPVVVGAGGAPHEALDHVLATKVLRKLRGRYDLTPDGVAGLQKTITAKWSAVFKSEPAKCTALLAAELKRLGHRL